MGNPTSAKKRYYTKSRYKTSCECPTKLYYASHAEYGNKKLDDPFLRALAKGGFQVGALAKVYYPDGHDITAIDYETSLRETAALLKQDEVTIFEAAIRYEDWFIRVDVLRKIGDKIEVIEVKSKGFDPNEENPFLKVKGLKKDKSNVKACWESYMQDIAFQALVVKRAFPKAVVVPYLMMADKSVQTTVEGLNQRFLLVKKDKRQGVKVLDGTNLETVGDKILCCKKVDDVVEHLHSTIDDAGRSFEERAHYFAKMHMEDKQIEPVVGPHCKNCEFRVGDKYKAAGKRSGFDECWSSLLDEKELEQPLVFDVWNYRGTPKRLSEEKYLMKDLNEEDIKPKQDDKPGLSASQRQWVQVEKTINKDDSVYFDMEGLASEMKKWKYPLHFIDFETTMVAIPFNKGRRAYEQIAFQFSHHVVNKDGSIVHQGEYINDKRGEFPNFEFVRALKKELETDNGTIFRYSNHENSILSTIVGQLEDSDEPDREELVEWIKTITKSTASSKSKWEGERQMVDQLVLVKQFFYDPSTQGSNSIKKVLPAVLNASEYLQEKYSKPVYGTALLPSLNFQEMKWLKRLEDGTADDPYKMLPPVFEGVSNEEIDGFICDDEVADGGAAMIAYAMMQFGEMSDTESTHLRSALLRYCELDTLAMVMIWEYWRERLEKAGLMEPLLLKAA